MAKSFRNVKIVIDPYLLEYIHDNVLHYFLQYDIFSELVLLGLLRQFDQKLETIFKDAYIFYLQNQAFFVYLCYKL